MQGAGDILAQANDQFMAKPTARMAMADAIRKNRQLRLDNSLQHWTDANRVAPGFGFNMLSPMAGILTAGGFGTKTRRGTETEERESDDGGGGLLGGLKSIAGLASMISGLF
jgi:hypothetical protein